MILHQKNQLYHRHHHQLQLLDRIKIKNLHYSKMTVKTRKTDAKYEFAILIIL